MNIFNWLTPANKVKQYFLVKDVTRHNWIVPVSHYNLFLDKQKCHGYGIIMQVVNLKNSCGK